MPGTPDAQTAYATLALGSAMALFLYPHALTGALSSKSANTVRRNAALLPAYSLVLGLIALLGYMAIAAGIQPAANPNDAVPDLFLKFFPSWFTGVAFAAIAIGALVPAAVMSIAAANLFTRNIYREFLRPDATPAPGVPGGQDRLALRQGRRAGLRHRAADQVRDRSAAPRRRLDPADPPGGGHRPLHTRWLDARAMLCGWLAGMALGTYMAIDLDFKGSVYKLFGINAYEALWGLAINLVVAVALTAVLPAVGAGDSADETVGDDYEELDPGSARRADAPRHPGVRARRRPSGA